MKRSQHHPSTITMAKLQLQDVRPCPSPTAYLSLLLRLLSILGALLLLLGAIIATNTLVNIQFPIGDWYSTGDPNTTDLVSQDAVGPWLMGSAVDQCVAAAVLAGLAGAFVGRVWESPRGGRA